MKKVFKIEVDCAICANKVQEAVKKIDGIKDANVNFMTQKMIIEVEQDDEKLVEKILKVAKKVEPDFEIL